jgi:hypothetical protein
MISDEQVVNGVLIIRDLFGFYANGNNIAGSAYPMTAAVTWSDTFLLPRSSPTDILKITADIGSASGLASIEIGPNPDFKDTSACLPNFEKFCALDYVESASGIKSGYISGNHQFTQALDGDPGPVVNFSDQYLTVSIERFLADGTTPDPYTSPAPEPSQLDILATSLGLLIAGWRPRRTRTGDCAANRQPT